MPTLASSADSLPLQGNTRRTTHNPLLATGCAAQTPPPRPKSAGWASKYIGRVGALAIVLGISGVVATTPAVAWAEDPPSISTDAPASSETPSEAEADPSPEATSPAPQSDSDESEDEQTPNDPDPDDSSSQTVSTPAEGVIVRSSGGAVSSDSDDDDAELEPESDDELDPADLEEPPPPADIEPPDSSRPLTVANENKVRASRISVDNSRIALREIVDDSLPIESVRDTFTPLTGEPTTATAPFTAFSTAIDVAPKHEQPTAPTEVIDAAVQFVNLALAPLLATGPTAPPESPLVWALLAWTRRQFGQDNPTETPVAAPMQTTETADTAAFAAEAATSSLPAELERTVLVSGLDSPVDFRILPNDMGIIIAEKNGALKLFHGDHVGTIGTLPVSSGGERGIGGIEIDPDFETNHYVYASYTAVNGSGVHVNRLSRLTLSDDLHEVEAEKVILEFSEPNTIHHGGTIRFSPVDGMLYWSTGENSYAPNSQDLSNLHGKIIRIDPTTLKAAAGNPFLNTPGVRPEIYAYGLRNPFRFAFTPEGHLLVGDVGGASWEELNLVIAGGNYGWSLAEGYCDGCSFVNPIYAYPHTPQPARAGAITSVLYYTSDALGEQYQNKVFISDYSLGWIKVLTFDEDFTSLIDVQTFDEDAGAILQLQQGPDGYLYELDYFGELSVIAPSGGNRAPQAVISATPDNGYADLEVGFSGADSSDPEGSALTYSWDFGVEGDADTSTDVAPTWTYTEDGSYLVTLTVTDVGGKTSQATHQVVVGSTAPTIGEIKVSQTKYNAGDTITFSTTASDADDGILGSDDYEWTVIFHHADHIHPFAEGIVGTGGSVTIPRDAHNVDTTYYEVVVTVTDSSGLTATKSVNVYPNLVELQFGSNDPDAVYTIDGVPHKGIYTETGVVGVERVVGALPTQFVNGKKLVFGAWSDGKLPTHTIVTPSSATTYTVVYDEYVAPRTPDLQSIPTQILRAQGANVERITSALNASAGVLTTALTNIPVGLADSLAELTADPLRFPEIAADIVHDFVRMTALAVAPTLNALADVVATEIIRTVSVASAIVTNVVPLTAVVLNAPIALANIIVHTTFDLIEAIVNPDPQGAFAALDRAQVLLVDEFAKQQSLIVGAFANLVDGVATAVAIPLPPPADSGAAGSDPLSPITRSVERTLRMASQVVQSSVTIVGTTIGGQLEVADFTARSLGILAAAGPGVEFALDWASFTLTQIARDSNAERIQVLHAIEKAAADLARAAQES